MNGRRPKSLAILSQLCLLRLWYAGGRERRRIIRSKYATSTRYQFLQAEVNAFYLKFLLWVPPRNPLNAYRLVYFSISAAPSVREAYQYLTDPYGGMGEHMNRVHSSQPSHVMTYSHININSNCKRLGAHAWLTIANVMTETLICVKFGRDVFHTPTPTSVVAFWSVFTVTLVAYGARLFMKEHYPGMYARLVGKQPEKLE